MGFDHNPPYVLHHTFSDIAPRCGYVIEIPYSRKLKKLYTVFPPNCETFLCEDFISTKSRKVSPLKIYTVSKKYSMRDYHICRAYDNF